MDDFPRRIVFNGKRNSAYLHHSILLYYKRTEVPYQEAHSKHRRLVANKKNPCKKTEILFASRYDLRLQIWFASVKNV